MSVLLSDVVSGSAVGLRGRLWQLSASELRAAAVSASAEILRLEAVRVAVVDELSLRPDDQVIASRGVGSWLAANTMLQVRDGKKIAALGAALRPFPAVAARFDCGDCSFEHAVLIVAFCESPPKGMPDEALPRCIDLLLAAASGVEATTTKVRNVIATLERLFESDEIPPAEDVDRNELRIASTLNGRVVVRGDFDALTGEMMLSRPVESDDDHPGTRWNPRCPVGGEADRGRVHRTDPALPGLREDRHRRWPAAARERAHQRPRSRGASGLRRNTRCS